MKIKLIIAVDRNGAMGINNSLPWKLRDDLINFKKTTINCPIIMGSSTFKSLPGILPNREHIVLSTTLEGDENKSVFTSIKEALDYCEESNYETVYVIGGANVIKQFAKYNMFDELIITHVDAIVEHADTFISLYNDLDLYKWTFIDTKHFEKNENNDYNFTIKTYKKTHKRFY